MKTPIKNLTYSIAVSGALAIAASSEAQTDITGFNTVTGFAADSAGAFNYNDCSLSSVTGFENGSFAGFLNNVNGIRNFAGTSAARSTVGGWGSGVNGTDCFVQGTWTNDGGHAGTFMFSDHDPLLVREASPFVASRDNALWGMFNGGYDLRTSDNSASRGLFIDANGTAAAEVGINDTSPSFPLQVQGGADAALGSGGYVVVGSEFGSNVAIDNNEIMARSAGSAATLSLNNDGGDVVIGNTGNISGLGLNTTPGGGVTMRIRSATGHQFATIVEAPDGADLVVVNDSTNFAGHTFWVATGTAAKPGGGAWAVFSDRRLKKDIEELESGLDTVMKLRPVTYEYKDPDAINELPGRQTGFIAQEVEEVMPEWVSDNADTGYKSLSIRGFESLSVKAIQELHKEGMAKDERLRKLEATVADLQEKLAKSAE